MKINRPIKAYLRRGAFYLLLLLAVCVIQFALALAAAPARAQIEQKSAPGGIALQSAHHHATVSESSPSPERRIARKSARIEISASHQRVSGREIAGFSARQARTGQEEKLTSPAGLKPVEQEAWLAMARRQGASDVGLGEFLSGTLRRALHCGK